MLPIKDYQVNIRITTNVEFLKVPESESLLLFKQPDKVKLKSERFSLIPKKFQFFSPLVLLKYDYSSFIEREEMIAGIKCYVIKIIPTGESNEIILTTAWVDIAALVFRKVDVTTKKTGSILLTMDYDNNVLKQYPLPSKIVFSFDISNISIPKGISGDFDEENHKKSNKPKLTKGSVEINFTNYKVNIGLTDGLFEDKKK